MLFDFSLILKSALILFFFYSLGAFFPQSCKKYGNVAVGLVSFVAFVQLFIIPVYFFEIDVYVSCILFCLLFSIVVVFGVISLYFKRTGIIGTIVSFFEGALIHKTTIILFFLIVLAIMFSYFNFYKSNSDDAFYIANINTSIETNKWFCIEPSTGNPNLSFSGNYIISSWEAILVFFSFLFNVNGAVLSHTILPLVLIPIHYSIVIIFSKKISRKNYAILAFFYCIMDFFSMYSDYQVGRFLMARIWQGKAVMANILFPLVLIVFIELFEEKMFSQYYIFIFAIILLAGIGFNPSGIYLVPILYGGYCLSYIMMKLLMHTKSKDLKKELLNMIIPVIIIIPIVVLRLFYMQSRGDLLRTTERIGELNYVDKLQDMIGTGYCLFAIYILSIVICSILGTYEIRFLVSVFSGIIFISVLNPYLCSIVGKLISSPLTYYRLFWVLQPQFTILMGFYILIRFFETRNKENYIALILLVLCCFTIWGGENEYIKQEFRKKTNFEAITDFTKTVVDKINADEYYKKCIRANRYPRILLPERYGNEVREYNATLEVVWTKYCETLLTNSVLIEGFMKDLYDNNDCTDLLERCNEFDIDYIALSNKMDCSKYYNEIRLIYSSDKYSVYRIIKD